MTWMSGRSGSVCGVDPDIFVGQVAGQHPRRGITPAKRDPNQDLRLGHDCRAGGFGIARGTSTGIDDQGLIEMDADPLDVEIGQSGAPNSGQDASPVRVGGKQGSLHQW